MHLGGVRRYLVPKWTQVFSVIEPLSEPLCFRFLVIERRHRARRHS